MQDIYGSRRYCSLSLTVELLNNASKCRRKDANANFLITVAAFIEDACPGAMIIITEGCAAMTGSHHKSVDIIFRLRYTYMHMGFDDLSMCREDADAEILNTVAASMEDACPGALIFLTGGCAATWTCGCVDDLLLLLYSPLCPRALMTCLCAGRMLMLSS